MRPHLTVRQASGQLACCERTILRRIREGKLRAYKIGTRYRIHPDDLERYRQSTVAPVGDDEEAW